MSSLGQSMKVASGKIEAVIAGAILIAVTVLFAKYYDRGSPAAERTSSPPPIVRQ